MIKENIDFSTEEGQEEFHDKSKEEKEIMIESSQVEAKKLNEIKDYEKRNNVDQDIIAKSYLSHVDIYKTLLEESRMAMDKFYLLKKSNGPDHPVVNEAKLDWDIAQAKVNDERNIMLPMLNNLTKETLDRYKEDFKIGEVYNDSEDIKMGNSGEKISEAERCVDELRSLSEEVMRTGKSSDPNYSQKREELDDKIDNYSKEISDQLGIKSEDIFLTTEEQFRGGNSNLLRKIISIAREAQRLDFSINSKDNNELIEEAKRLIDDYDKYTKPVLKTRQHPDKDYSSRREAKQLLIEGLTRELAKRLDLGDGRDSNSVNSLIEKTGIDFFRAVRKIDRIYSVPSENLNSNGRVPEMGHDGVWQTSSGDIDGKIVSGGGNGPYTIETSDGKIQVDKIF